ncbi:MAG: hypothetical protein KDD67_02370 [Ignavibacteriae bacterium]|nr:hypothetical protein [Ignavibacteriota bacterium]MCB9216884.1 hypothetical protein [Ignavibacteria bacterium]
MSRTFSTIFLLFALFVVACEKRDNGPSNIVEIPEGLPDEDGENMTIILSDSAWKKAIIQAGHARKFNTRQETLIDNGIYVQFFDRLGETTAILHADSARIDDNTGNMCAFGNVDVYSRKNKTAVDTEVLCYDKEKGKLHSEDHFQLVDTLRGRFVRGKGFESDESLREYTIYQVTGEATAQR